MLNEYFQIKVHFMETKLNKNTGQILKLMHETLALGQKVANDPLKNAPPTVEAQTQRAEQQQRIEQTDLRSVAVQISAEAKHSIHKAKRKKPKTGRNKKRQQQSNER